MSLKKITIYCYGDHSYFKLEIDGKQIGGIHKSYRSAGKMRKTDLISLLERLGYEVKSIKMKGK